MAKAILICGKICSGKTEYAKSLIKNNPAVLLSADEITLAIFGTDTGAEHDSIVEKTQKYLYQKSVEIINSGTDVILDWGFWTREERREASTFFKARGIDFEWHYLDVSEELLRANLIKRNLEIETGQITFYYFENALAERFWDMFEPPAKAEIDVWIAAKK